MTPIRNQRTDAAQPKPRLGPLQRPVEPSEPVEPMEGTAADPDAADEAEEGQHPFTNEQYDAAVADMDPVPELVAEVAQTAGREEAGEPLADAEDQGDESGPLDSLDPATAKHVRKLREEAAASRTALAAATAEVASLSEFKQGRMKQDVERMAAGSKMIQPSELWHVATMADFLDPKTGDVSEAKVAEVVDSRVPEHWKVQLRNESYRRTAGPVSGASGTSEVKSTNWSQALAPKER